MDRHLEDSGSPIFGPDQGRDSARVGCHSGTSGLSGRIKEGYNSIEKDYSVLSFFILLFLRGFFSPFKRASFSLSLISLLCFFLFLIGGLSHLAVGNRHLFEEFIFAIPFPVFYRELLHLKAPEREGIFSLYF